MHYSIQYKKGVESRVEDALSRKIEGNEPSLQDITVVSPKWVEETVLSYENDYWAKENPIVILVDPNNLYNLTINNGLLKYKGDYTLDLLVS